MTHPLETPGALKQLAMQIKSDIDSFCVWKYNDGPRSHLGASLIGHPCSRHLWYSFRHIVHKVHDGRQYRLFQRGHFEEPRFTSYLQGIGCTVTDLALNLFYNAQLDCYSIEKTDYPATANEVNVTDNLAHIESAKLQGVNFDKGKAQIRISDCHGHFGGSLDAIVTLPERYGLGDVLFLGEYKTQGQKKFGKLVDKGCELEKNQHFCQQSVYGFKLGLQYGVYIVVNKDNDDLYIEVVKLDWVLGAKMIEKANNIIFSQTPPNKIAKTASYYECNYCDSKAVCWKDEPALKNCRSCANCRPIINSKWECRLFGPIPNTDAVKAGCDKWESLV